MKRIYFAFVPLVIILIGLGIYLAYQPDQPIQQSDKTLVVASFYPLAFMTESIGGDNVDVICLIPYNSEAHSWQPSISDIGSLEEANIIIYNGAGLEPWMLDILEAININDKIIVEASKNVTLIDSSGDPDISPGQKDPHTWVSPFTAQKLAKAIFEALNESDPVNGGVYFENYNKLKLRLQNLDSQYINELKVNTRSKIFVTHGAFGYLATRYGFKQMSVIGLSADEQPSTSTLSALVEQMVDANATTIFVDPVYSSNYAMTLKVELEHRLRRNFQVSHLYLMLGPVDDLDYFGQMEANLQNLKSALR